MNRPGTLVIAAWLALAATTDAQGQNCTGPTIVRRGPQNAQVLWPRDLISPAAVFSRADNTLMLLGTSPSSGATQLWEWNGFEWRLLVPLDGITPPSLIGAAAAYHDQTGRIVLFGGTLPSGNDSNRTYLWNGEFWDEPNFNDTPPQPVHDAILTSSDALGRVVLFGGVRNGADVSETWTWGLGGWRLETTPLHPHGGGVRNTAAYFPRTQMVMYCETRIDPANVDAWGLWQFGAGGWERIAQLQQPGAGAGFEEPTVFDPENSAILASPTADLTREPSGWVWPCCDELWYFDRYMDPPLPRRLYDLTTATDTLHKKVIILGRSTPSGDLELWEHDSTPGGVDISEPTISYGFNTNIFVLASGQGTLSFEWLRDGQPIQGDDAFEGVESQSMAIDAARLRCNTFALSCRVCGSCGCQTSQSVTFAFHYVADFNVDGGTDGQDVEAFMLAWEAADTAADVNCDGGVDGPDVQTFFDCWANNCDR